MASLYARALQQHAEQHVVTLKALARQQPFFERIDGLTAALQQRCEGVEVESCYLPTMGSFISLKAAVLSPALERAVQSVCDDFELGMVRQGDCMLQLVERGQRELQSVPVLLSA